jgi:hypothetical protein
MKVDEEKKLTLREFGELCGIKYSTLCLRLSNGLSLRDACTLTSTQLRRKAATKHGMHRSPEYSSWESMHSRCAKHQHYVDRGIEVCERWKAFENFLEDMGPRPEGTTLDRIDGNKGYEPGNCRWATAIEQAHNRPSNRFITIDGQTKVLAQWAREYGISERTVGERISRGYSPIEALTMSAYKRRGKNVG